MAWRAPERRPEASVHYWAACDPADALDIIIMLTVGVNLAQNNSGLVSALPFIGATVLVAALPLLFFLLFHRRAQQFMPKVRDWMNSNSWLVNIIVCGVFIVLILL